MPDPEVAVTRRIVIDVGLDANRVPVAMRWSAEEAAEPGDRPCQSVLLSLWDRDGDGAGHLHLWTREMRVDEMHRFVHHTLHALAESWARATQRRDLGDRLRALADELLPAALQPPEPPGG